MCSCCEVPDVIYYIACVTSCSVGTPVVIFRSSFGVGVNNYGCLFPVQKL